MCFVLGAGLRRYVAALLCLLMAVIWLSYSAFCYFVDENDVEIFYQDMTSHTISLELPSSVLYTVASKKPDLHISSFISKDFSKQAAKAEERKRKKEEEERKKQEQERLQKERKLKVYYNSLPTICQNDGVADSWVQAVNEQLRVIPATLLQQFQAQGWHMYCTSDDIDKVHFGGQFGSVMGVTVYDNKVIYIEDRQIAVTESPVHEFGHYLDYSLGFISHQAEFMNIYQREQATFRNAYGVPGYFNQEELFAEAFWRYLTSNRASFRSSVPGLCSFFDKVVG